MDKYGNTKLDHVLSYISEGFGKSLEWLLIVGLPFGVIEQICIYGTVHPDQIISLLLVLMIILSAFLCREIKKLKKRDDLNGR